MRWDSMVVHGKGDADDRRQPLSALSTTHAHKRVDERTEGVRVRERMRWHHCIAAFRL